MQSNMWSVVPSAVALGLMATAAILIAARRRPSDRPAERRAAAVALAMGTLVQLAHFAEEATSGFHARFPAMFGFPPIPVAVFVGLNVTWLLIWAVAVRGVSRGNQVAFAAAWFLAIASTANALAHPALAIAAAGYFPGLATAPVAGAAGVWLGLRLHRATRLTRTR